MKLLVTPWLVLCAASCAHDAPAPAPRSPASHIVGLSIPNDGDSLVQFDTGKARGTVTIQKGLPVGYQNVTETTTSGTSSRTLLTVRGLVLVIEEDAVRIGDQRIGPLQGDVTVAVRPDGVFVDDVKKADLPR